MLGHELRNPLNAITMSQAIVDQFPPQNPIEERARGVARRQTAHLTRLVNDLLEVSRVTRGKITLDRQPLDLAGSLRQVIAIVEQTTLRPRQQTLTASLPEYPVHVVGDRVRLEQVFTNLLDNASKYSPEGSPVSIELEVDSHQQGGGEPQAVVTVLARGRGIGAEQRSHVFDLFYQGQPTEPRIGTGLGIGLTLVRSLIESHGGSVAVRSNGPGTGSEFEVRLPTQPDAVLAAAHDGRQTASKRRRLARGTRTILVVEDNADAREMLATLCLSWGYAVELAEDGLQGLDKALQLRPRIALVDIGLPGIDGYELARRVRASAPPSDIKLVALTGYGLPEQRQKALAAGFDLHLVKPVDADALATFLDQSSLTTDAPSPPERAHRSPHSRG